MSDRIENIRIFVHEWERAVAFYSQTLGLPIAYQSAELGWAEIGGDGAKLAIERLDRDDPEASTLVGRFVGVSIRVDDVEARHAVWVERGVRFARPPEEQIWGGTLAHFEDPEGNVLTLVGGGESR